jgi:NDP-sugar pyrophosphorylase family protein
LLLLKAGARMNAVILAGGKGSRLWPLTKEIPKPMLPVKGRPLICHQIELLKKYGLDKITISIGYLGEMIENYLKDGRAFGVKIKYARESKPLGTGGGIKNCERFVENSPVLIMYGDIFTQMNVKNFVEFHERCGGIASIVVHKTDHPLDSDLVILTKGSKIEKIIGKPERGSSIPSEISKTSIYIFEKKVFDYIPKAENSFEDDVMSFLVQKEKVYGYLTDEIIKDIGTFERYKKINNNY